MISQKSYFFLAALMLINIHADAQTSQVSSAEKAAKVYQNIYANFYDSSKNLFREKTAPEKDDRDFSYLWPLCALVQAANEMEVMEPGKQYLAPVVKMIDLYYSKKPPHPGYDSYLVQYGGGDRFYDDNQWIGIAYLDAYNRTKDGKYLNLSKDIYDFMMTGYDTISGGGLYWKEFDLTTKNTCSNGPAVLMALQLYKATKEKRYLDTALLIYNWTNKYLTTPDGLYYDNVKLPSLKIDKAIYSYNTGTMLQSMVLLYEITKDKKYRSLAQKVAAASLSYFYKNDVFPQHYWFNVVLLRGYEELLKADPNKKYINAFKTYAEKVWQNESDSNKLIGTKPVKSLIDQAGYLEIVTRLAKYE